MVSYGTESRRHSAKQQKASVELRALMLSPCLRLLNVLLLCWFSYV